MSNHTPGPWQHSYDHCTVFGRTGWSIGPVGITTAVCGDTPAPDECEANARLIAAAPELLAALLSALPFVEDSLDDDSFKRGYVRKTAGTIRAAIAKATE